MNKLSVIENNITVDSRQIAEWTSKEHKNILRDIVNEINELGEIGKLIFEPTSYLDSFNRSQPCYKMNRKGVMQLALKYDAVVRYKVIEKLEELENRNNIPQIDSKFMFQLSQAMAEKEKQVLELTSKIEADQPKVLFAEAVTSSNDCILIGNLSKLIKQNGYDIGEKRLFQWLREYNYLIKSGERKNTPTQKSMNLGLFEVREFSQTFPDGTTKLRFTTKVTGKGQVYFINKFLKELQVLQQTL